MPAYANTTGLSNVKSYRDGADLDGSYYVAVEFGDGSTYVYTEQSAGRDNLERMMQLGRAGSGLNAFINRHVRKRYARKY